MTVTFLSEDEFVEASEKILAYDHSVGRRSNWQRYRKRWRYHARTVDLIRSSGVSSPGEVLEMGTAGVQLVKGGHTMDYQNDWAFPGLNPTYLHDARKFPWPIADRRYKFFAALRVFHHLSPVQQECFNEAARIADNVLIVVPEPPPEKPHKGITLQTFKDWNRGRAPTLVEPVDPFGFLYFWDREALGRPVAW